MMTFKRKDYVFKFDGKIGTIEDTRNQVMYFLTDLQSKKCCALNSNLDTIIEFLKMID